MNTGPSTVLFDRLGGREFRLLRRLGEGGFGEVYLARLRSPGGLDQRVAVKLLLPDPEEGNQALERLRDEAEVLSRLHHPVILAAHDLVELGNRVALVTEYVEGQDLGECIVDRRDPIPLGALLDVIGQVAGALDAAWTSERIVHRDVKPANIRIGRHGNVKLLDFGIAKSVGTAPRTQKNVVMGSLHYLAPERFELDRSPTPASDVFALGCVVYDKVRGSLLFNKLDVAQLFGLSKDPVAFKRYIEQKLEPIDLTAPLTSKGHADTVRDLLLRMFVRDPDARITAGELAQECDALVRELPADETLRAWCRQRQWPTVPDDPSSASTLSEDGTPLPPSARVVAVTTDEARPPPAARRTPAGRTPPTPPARSTPAPAPSRSAEASTVLRSNRESVFNEAATIIRGPSKDETPADDGGTLAVPLPLPRTTSAPLAWLGAAASIVVVGLLIGGVVVLAMGTVWVVLAAASGGPEPVVPPIAPEPPGIVPALPIQDPEPVVPDPPAPELPPERDPPGRTVTPVAPAPADPTPAAPRRPHPVEPAPARPTPAPAVAMGSVKIVGAKRAELRSSDGKTHAPGDYVPAGDWQIWADFGPGYMHAGKVTIVAGHESYVVCKQIKMICVAD